MVQASLCVFAVIVLVCNWFCCARHSSAAVDWEDGIIVFTLNIPLVACAN